MTVRVVFLALLGLSFAVVSCSKDRPAPVAPSGKASASLAAPSAPTNLRFDAPTDSSSTVRWDASDGATDYDVNYKPASGGRWTNEPHKGTRLYNTIYDLEPDTEYRWAVRAENGDGASEWIHGPNFTTAPSGKASASLAAPSAPTNLRFDAPTDSSSTVRWDASDGATDYDVNYKPASGGRWTNEPHAGDGLYNTIHDLEPRTEYRWAVRAENSNGASEWVFGPNFTTLSDNQSRDETDGDGGGSDDHGNTRSEATDLPLDSSLAGEIETGEDVDYFRVQVGAPGVLTLGTTGSLDTKGRLESHSGAHLASDDDGGSGNNFSIAHPVSAGTYYVRVASHSILTGSYTIIATVRSAPTDEPEQTPQPDEPETPSDDATLSALTVSVGTLTPSFDPSIENYTVSVAHSVQEITITATGNDRNASVDVSEKRGLVWEGFGENVRTFPLKVGENQLGVLVVAEDGQADNLYTVTVTRAAEKKTDDVGNTPETAKYISLNEPPEGSREAEGTGFGPWELTEGDVDYFKFILTNYYTFGVLSTDETDTYGVLYDDEGNVISSNDDHEGEPGFFVVGVRLKPGVYYLKVTGYNQATGSYFLAAALARDRSRLGKPTVSAQTPQQEVLQTLELELDGR